MHRSLILVIVLVVFLSAGCSSTRVVSNDTYKGDLIDVEKEPREVEREKTAFSLDAERVKLIRTTHYATPQVSTYQRMRKIEYEDTSKSPRLSILVTPLCPLMTVVTFILEPPRKQIPLGECLHTLGVNEEVTSRTKERPVKDDPVLEKRTTHSSERKPLTGVEVPLLLDGKLVETLEINDKGYADYDLLALIEENNIHPRDLVHGESLRLRARYQEQSSAYQLSARSIPEAYFEAQYQRLRENLVSENKARHDNCRAIGVDFREFFECYYQRNLM